MTYICHNELYNNGIHELSFDEISEVGGGPGPLAPAVVVGGGILLGGGAIIVVGVIVVNGLAGLADGLAGNPQEK
jgi:hypothetical protein